MPSMPKRGSGHGSLRRDRPNSCREGAFGSAQRPLVHLPIGEAGPASNWNYVERVSDVGDVADALFTATWLAGIEIFRPPWHVPSSNYFWLGLWDCWKPATSYCDTAFGFLVFPFGSGFWPA